jgi:hypothetical protein
MVKGMIQISVILFLRRRLGISNLITKAIQLHRACPPRSPNQSRRVPMEDMLRAAQFRSRLIQTTEGEPIRIIRTLRARSPRTPPSSNTVVLKRFLRYPFIPTSQTQIIIHHRRHRQVLTQCCLHLQTLSITMPMCPGPLTRTGSHIQHSSAKRGIDQE